MAQTNSKKISPLSKSDWSAAIKHFNRLYVGKTIKVERYGGGKEHEHMEKALPLQSISYDRQGDRDILTIAVGQDRIEQEYRVDDPTEMWAEPLGEEKGELLEIVDQDARHTVLSVE